MKNFLLLILLSALVGACSSSQCRKTASENFFAEKTKDLPQFQKQKAEKTGLGLGSTSWVRVYKNDGSKQCGMGVAITPKEMSKELRDRGIKVKSMKKQNDGLMRIQVCGSPTGMINVFEIQESNIKSAESAGFRKFKK